MMPFIPTFLTRDQRVLRVFGLVLRFADLERSRGYWKAVNTDNLVRVPSGRLLRLATRGPLTPLQRHHRHWAFALYKAWLKVVEPGPDANPCSHFVNVLALGYLLNAAYIELNHRFPAGPHEFDRWSEFVYSHDEAVCALHRAARAAGGKDPKCEEDACIVAHRAWIIRGSFAESPSASSSSFSGGKPLTRATSYDTVHSAASSSPSSSPSLPPALIASVESEDARMAMLDRALANTRTVCGMVYWGPGPAKGIGLVTGSFSRPVPGEDADVPVQQRP